MFERFKKAVKNWFMRAGADMGLARDFKSIFELGGVPAFQQFYNFGIFPWKYLYKGYYEAWHLVPAPTIKDQNAKRRMFYLNLSKAVCSELAGMVWTDQTDISISTNGFTPTEANPDDPLQAFVEKVLHDNNFNMKMLESIEQAAALGGEALKVWHEVRHDREGNEVPESGRLKIGYCMADQFVPTAWDNAEVTEGVFISRIAKGGYYYTRLEWHKWDGLTYVITNELYRAEMYRNGNTQEPQDILGMRVPLAEIYPLLDEETVVEGVEKSLFSYFRTPTANNIDNNSPLGVSIYANAMETLHALDICFDSFVREFRLGKKRIIVPARMVKTIVDPVTGVPRRYFDATDETYEALSTDDPDSLKIQDNSVALRVEEHVAAMNAFLNIFCLQVGLSAGTFAFDAKNNGIKTATEVVSENSKTYKTVKNFQNMIRPAVIRLVENIIAVASLYEMQTEDGQSVRALAERGYEVNVNMDDGITQDRQTNINEGITLVGAGLMSKKTFLTDPKYGQGLTDEDADAELERIANEGRVNSMTIDRLNMNTAE
jgi:A118 family predicted phage portal protein